MSKRIAVLGSTGSVGTQTLQVVERFEDRLEVVALSAGSNVELLAEQIERWDPEVVSLRTPEAAADLERRLGRSAPRCLVGQEGLAAVAGATDLGLVLNAVVGAAGVAATWAAVQRGTDVALANKESLVAAGELIMSAASRSGSVILPVDSEHNALHQCLRGSRHGDVRRLILTASGGPFFGRSAEELAAVTPEQALAHPTWQMGARITVDSATMMNKGFEIIEARWLFDLPPERIDVVVHPQSMVHSLVEFVDGTLLAQAGPTDMRLPIQDALSYPGRWPSGIEPLRLHECGPWSFHEPDDRSFPAPRLARRALERGGTAPTALNAADEVAVAAFLDGALRFDQIVEVVGEVVDAHEPLAVADLEAVRRADEAAREAARRRITALAGQLVD